MKPRSLVGTLICGVLMAEFVCALLFSVVAWGHDVRERERALDVLLRGRADSVLGAIQDAEDRDDNVIVDEAELPLPHEDAYIVLTASGRTAGRSPYADPEVLRELQSSHADGYFTFTVKGVRYRAIRQPGLRVIDREEQVGGLRRPVTILYATSTTHLWHQALEATRFYVLVSCLLVLITGFAIAWFLRRELSPLRELAQRAERVTPESWDFTAPKEILRVRELLPIAVSIEKLLRSLQSAFERQRRFTGDAAHELKTSIALLKSSLQLIAMRERTPQQYQTALEDLLQDTTRMEALTSRMLTLARVEESAPERDAVTQLPETIRDVVQRLSPAAAIKGIRIEQELLPRLAVRLASHDADLLCSNLLINAVEHSSAGTCIRVSTRVAEDQAEMLVSDEGEGIDSAALPHIFERFYRSDASRSRRNGGVGLGLAICRAVVSRGQGAIDVVSTPGRGTTVRVLLPCVEAQQQCAMDAAAAASA